MILTKEHNYKIFWGLSLLTVALFWIAGLIKFLIFILFSHLFYDVFSSFLVKNTKICKKNSIRISSFALVLIIGLLTFYISSYLISNYAESQKSLIQVFNQRMLELSDNWGINFNFSKIKYFVLDYLKKDFKTSFLVANTFVRTVFLLIMAVVVNHAFFLKNTTQETLNDNFYIKFSNFISLKSHQYYLAFKKVITAQMIISAINTFLSFFILFALGFPFKIALLLLIFMAGLIPVLGNLVSNTVICAVAFIYLGIPEVIISLIFLLVIHKLEYLLNSKIIGNKIDIPMYQILLTIILGEAILGINGIIIAVPTLLFIKEQFKKIS